MKYEIKQVVKVIYCHKTKIFNDNKSTINCENARASTNKIHVTSKNNMYISFSRLSETLVKKGYYRPCREEKT